MRRLIVFAGAVGLACASLQPPPGGPQRKVPPAIVSVTPDSGAINVKDKSAVFTFDVIVDDRAGRGGTLAGSFLVSPNEGGTVVSWHRDRVEVRPRKGFRQGVAYSVTMLPGVADLNRNVMRETRVTTFSTGPTIPPFAIHGRVFDWMTERIARDARVDIVHLPDSLPYVGIADSTGQFAIGPLDTGRYVIRAFVDNNRNGLVDRNELWDTTSVDVRATSPFVELRTALRDTLGPRLLTVAPADSLTLNLSFDHPLDPTDSLTPAAFRVQRADSSALTVSQVYTAAQYQVVKARRDSVREAARRDSVARADTTTRPAAPVAKPGAPVPIADPGGRGGLPTAVVPKPSVRAPARDVVLELDAGAPLQPGAEYRVTARNARSIAGVVRASDRLITVPRRDTTTTPVRKP